MPLMLHSLKIRTRNIDRMEPRLDGASSAEWNKAGRKGEFFTPSDRHMDVLALLPSVRNA